MYEKNLQGGFPKLFWRIKMKIKFIFLNFFCIFLLLACVERRIYLPDGKDMKDENKVVYKEEKISTEESKTSDKETLTFSELEGIIKKLSEEIGDIYFDYDKYDIRQSDVSTLKKVASALQKYPRLKVIVEGHCDERGTNEYNFALGQKRANAAKQYLVTLGVPSTKIEIISYGEEKPLCTEQNENCWQKNRRAHFVFIEEGK